MAGRNYDGGLNARQQDAPTRWEDTFIAASADDSRERRVPIATALEEPSAHRPFSDLLKRRLVRGCLPLEQPVGEVDCGGEGPEHPVEKDWVVVGPLVWPAMADGELIRHLEEHGLVLLDQLLFQQ